MKITQVAIRPTEKSIELNRPNLTPELLAATGARYSRNNEGLESIISKIDVNNLDKSVDSIFKMIDYGHQSIADMVPVAIFIDGISIWLAYHVWSLCPTAGGQEASTRYIKLGLNDIDEPEELGITTNTAVWKKYIENSFNIYEECLDYWKKVSGNYPELIGLPISLLEDTSEEAKKKVGRIKRNYAFDRARYFIPVAAKTNMMMVMSARGWTQLSQQLLSHYLPEAQKLGKLIVEELEIAAPRMVKHATEKESFRKGLLSEFEDMYNINYSVDNDYTKIFNEENKAYLQVLEPIGFNKNNDDLAFHTNRYDYIGKSLKSLPVVFGWNKVSLAEIRDLNRHRTGTKTCDLIPRGFYCALDQLPKGAWADDLRDYYGIALNYTRIALQCLSNKDKSYIYWTNLGTEYSFQHTTTADKMIYECELRTGLGSHFRYAAQLRQILGMWYAKYPNTKGKVLEGTAEPE